MKAWVLAIVLVAAVSAPAAAERRCGWIANPSPGNWWLIDARREWIMGVQGGRQAKGIGILPDFTAREWVAINGPSYGYGCACLDVQTKGDQITAIRSVRQLPLRKCHADKRLPRP